MVARLTASGRGKLDAYIRCFDIIRKRIDVGLPYGVKFIVTERCRIKITYTFPGYRKILGGSEELSSYTVKRRWVVQQ